MSVDLSWTVEREDGVRFVACRVHNAAAVTRRVRVRSRTEGPVLPPRRSGVPEEGWEAAGVTLRLDADERRGVGFAVVAPPIEPIADPPVEIADVCPIDDADSPAVTADAAVRSLGDHRPPHAALVGFDPSSAPDEDTGIGAADGDAAIEVSDAVTGPSSSGDDTAPPGEDDTTPPSEDDVSPSPSDRDAGGGAGGRVSRSAIGGPRPASEGVGGLDERLERAERRIERAERLTDADLETATDAVDRVGDVAAVATLAERVADDAVTLRRLSERASSLAARAEETDVPTEALERLA